MCTRDAAFPTMRMRTYNGGGVELKLTTFQSSPIAVTACTICSVVKSAGNSRKYLIRHALIGKQRIV